ncbi:MAG: winged helix DNA-binding domain-containing protein [Acidobacteriota bacterium]
MLLAREPANVLDAVTRLAGLQAQAPRPPFVGLWTRLAGFSRDDLLSQLSARRVVRVTAMRGTLHLMTAADYVALRGALQPALTRGMESALRGRTDALDVPALHAFARRFFAAAPATFDSLRSALRQHDPNADERAMAYAIRTSLPLVQVPTGARWGFPASADFALADAWLGTAVATDGTADLLVRRYLAAFGPATPADAQVWSGLPALREIFETLRPTLITFRDAHSRELFDLPDAPRPSDDSPAPVRFLPEFDNLVLSHADRTRVVADADRSRIVSKNLQVRATFLVDGVVAGTWKIERKKRTAALVVEPFRRLSRTSTAELEVEADRLLGFTDDDAEVRDVHVARPE